MNNVLKNVGSLFTLGIEGKTLSKEERLFIKEENISSFIIFSRNYQNPKQINDLINSIKEISPCSLFWVDQEGGLVIRFGEDAATIISPMGLSATNDISLVEKAGQIVAEDMLFLGFDGVFAPLLDVNYQPDNPVISYRSFGDNPSKVRDFAISFARGLNSKGILSCGKHFPGHGATLIDSHLDLPYVKCSESEFLNNNLFPFREFIRHIPYDSLMTAHVVHSVFSPLPASISPNSGTLLREDLGYKGIVFSDCLEMAALRHHFTPYEVIKGGILAGTDSFIVSRGLDRAKLYLDTLKSLIINKEITEQRIEESFLRIELLKQRAADLKKSVKKPNKLRTRYAEELEIAKKSITMLYGEKFQVIKEEEKVIFLHFSQSFEDSKVVDGKFINVERVFKKKFPFSSYSRVSKIKDKMFIGQNNSKIVVLVSKGDREMVKSINHLEIQGLHALVFLDNPYLYKDITLEIPILFSYGIREVQLEGLVFALQDSSLVNNKLAITL